MTPIVRDPRAKDVAMLCLKKYEDNNSAYLQDVLRHALSCFYSEMLSAEFLAHLGYAKSSSGFKDSDNRRNGFIQKKVRSSLGTLDVMVPRDRDGSFMPVAVRKHLRAVTATESQVLTMFARGMCDDDIMNTIQYIYGYELSQDKVQIIKQRVLLDIRESSFKPLRSVYAFVLLAKIDLRVDDRHGGMAHDVSIVVSHGVDQEGNRELLDMYIIPPGPKADCKSLLEHLHQRGIDDIVVLVADGIAVHERDVRHIFPLTMVY